MVTQTPAPTPVSLQADGTWEPTSWRALPAAQQPLWPDPADLEEVLERLATLPPLVFAGEARSLRAQLAEVAEGKGFLLQAGDCAESFDDLSANSIRDKLKVILQMAVTLTYGAGVPVVKVGRIAGQFAKPRSSDTERREDVELPSFRGHSVHGFDFSAESRRADPERLLTAYHHSAATLNLLRALTKGGFADMSRIHQWNLEFARESGEGRRYEQIAAEIDRALRFMRACGIDLEHEATLHEVDLYTSHEALILGYEESLTRRDSLTNDWYDCSAHFLWIGDRTRQVGGAHVGFLRGVHNPIGIKVGPSTDPGELVEVCGLVDPERLPGRLTLIARLGVQNVRRVLPDLLERVRASGHPVVWACDPMHGNTFRHDSGFKTRRFSDVMAELVAFFEVCRDRGVWPGGVHVELTGDDVTECLGGSEEIEDHHLERRYETICDPRLNVRQSLDLAFQCAELLRA